MNQGAGKTIGQNSPEALPEAFKGVWKLVPSANGKLALSNLWPHLSRGSGEVRAI